MFFFFNEHSKLDDLSVYCTFNYSEMSVCFFILVFSLGQSHMGINDIEYQNSSFFLVKE